MFFYDIMKIGDSVKKIFLIFILFICFTINVEAKKYQCEYDFTYNTGLLNWLEVDSTITFTIDTETKTITYPDKLFNEKPVYFLDRYVDSKYTDKFLVESLNGKCDATIVIGPIAYDSRPFSYAVFFEESNLYSLKKTQTGGYQLPTEFLTDEQILGFITDSAYGKIKEDNSTAESAEIDFGCDYVDKGINKLNSEDCNKINAECDKTWQELRGFCNTVTNNANYGISSCLTACLALDQYVPDYIIPSDGECGLSGRMIAWLKNILKWIKYILPVFVIILGILDFIKAISSGSDDEMKKAQGKFIKRLIAAALLFLIPALIEFILEVFKIESTFCGII